MRPSNQFAEITESQFQQREAEKNRYKADLLSQIDQQNRKRAEYKFRREIDDQLDEQRLWEQLGGENQHTKQLASRQMRNLIK